MSLINKLEKIDLILILFVLITTTIYPIIFFKFNNLPHEDVAILMCYSKNFTEGNGIVWNKDGLPFDDATDFLFMLLISFINYCEGPLELSGFLIIYFSCYYVSTDFIDSITIINSVQDLDYIWYENGEICANYAT